MHLLIYASQSVTLTLSLKYLHSSSCYTVQSYKFSFDFDSKMLIFNEVNKLNDERQVFSIHHLTIVLPAVLEEKIERMSVGYQSCPHSMSYRMK